MLGILLYSIAELMKQRRQKLHEVLEALGVLAKLTDANKHLLFRSKLRIKRRHSADSTHETQYEETAANQSEKPSPGGSSKGSEIGLEEKADEEEEQKGGANSYILKSAYDDPTGYCSFLQYMDQSYEEMCEGMKMVEPLCGQLIRQGNLEEFATGNVHKTIFFQEVWSDQIVSVSLRPRLIRDVESG